jgi:hypothetical protein
MTQDSMARYRLGKDGVIHHWLACGLVTSPLTGMEHVVGPDGSPFGDAGRWILNYWAFDPASAALKKRIYLSLPPLDWQPGSRPFLHADGIGGQRWAYAIADEDRVIDFSRFNFTPTLMQAWVFACLEVDSPATVQAELYSIGPARVWLNGTQLLYYTDRFSYVALQTIPLALTLQPGFNDLYLQGDMLGWREARLALGIRFVNAAPLSVRIPLDSVPPEQWHQAEDGLSSLVVKQFAFSRLPGRVWLNPAAPRPFTFEAVASMPVPEEVEAALGLDSVPEGRAKLTLAPGQSAELPITSELARAMAELPGENVLSLVFRPLDGMPLQTEYTVWASAANFSTQPYGTYESRLREALEHLAVMPYDVLGSMAAVEIGKRSTIDSDAVKLACRFVTNRFDCADFYAISLLALLYRYAGQSALRPIDQEQIETAFRSFKFWLDEPGLDAMCYFTENHQILFHVSAYLAGQRWPDWVFTNSGYTGREQIARNRPRIEAWIARRLNGNFSEWDSNAYLALDVYAMLALVEFADDLHLQAMATTLLHKIFFMIACQSYRGAHGSTHGRCYVTGLKSARVENTSSLQRIAWGMGIFNGETRATGLLTMARRYRVPDVIQHIGADLPDVLVTRVRSTADYVPTSDMHSGRWDVRTITWRTPDVMLSATVDYQPGTMGIQEHVWQATLGPDTVVFTTYPGNSQEHGNARPNFWAGSARLPRVGVYEKTVLCLYHFEPGVGLGFSHAYFPTAMFDEWRISGGWAFARVGSGYVALCADGDLDLTETGRHAGQELRSWGVGQAWIARIGRAAEDGDFETFCQSVMSHPPVFDGARVIWTTPDGSRLAFAWEGPLTVDGAEEDWDHFPHYENAYTQTAIDEDSMVLRWRDLELTLDLAIGSHEKAPGDDARTPN